ncbi:MAG: hypothetical protein HC838_08970 [Spirulinaceae cyanobacterium RM2_2_10]|nr:hypothetical protein [Spirulinaceae cyanobacterium RM2_2_10]
MAKHRTKKRNYRMINFKVYYDTDQDILDWWEGIEAGERSDAVRDLIREQLGSVRRRPSKAPIIDLPELLEVRRDTLARERIAVGQHDDEAAQIVFDDGHDNAPLHNRTPLF